MSEMQHYPTERQQSLEGPDLSQQLGEVMTDIDRVLDHEIQAGIAPRTNQALLKVSYLRTPTEDTRIQWYKNNGQSSLSKEEDNRYEIRREFSQDVYRSDQRILTIRVMKDGSIRGNIESIIGGRNSLGSLDGYSSMSVPITADAITDFKGALARKLPPSSEPTT